MLQGQETAAAWHQCPHCHCWVELLQHQGQLGLVAAEAKFPKGQQGIVPASSLGYVQEYHIAECSEPPSSSLSSMQGWSWKKREKDQMLWKS